MTKEKCHDYFCNREILTKVGTCIKDGSYFECIERYCAETKKGGEQEEEQGYSMTEEACRNEFCSNDYLENYDYTLDQCMNENCF